MIELSDLTKPTQDSIKHLKKISILTQYLCLGKRFEYDNRIYGMDGDCNLYIIGTSENMDTGVKREVPLFQNDCAWQLLNEMADTISEEELSEMKLHVSFNDVSYKFYAKER